MTSWAELRTVALVGTERRSLPESASGSPFLTRLPSDLSAERQALHVAALLSAARRAGGPVAHVPKRRASEAEVEGAPVIEASEGADLAESDEAVEVTAPAAAVQLLELILSGNAGSTELGRTLSNQWFARCHEFNMVVPRRLLVAVLEFALTTGDDRDAVLPVLGERGRWLASQRDRWAWVAEAPAADVEAGADLEMSVDELFELTADQRDAALSAIRIAAPAQGRQMIAKACERLDAASRARVLGRLAEDLTIDDEPLLEAALDDRSKAVRTRAIQMLNCLPDSARSARLVGYLEPLVERVGRLRKGVTVQFPSPPTVEQQRDMIPGGRGVIEQQWFDTLVGGTPLGWWEDHLAMSPDKIVNAKLEPKKELLAAFIGAATDQRNLRWAEALFAATKSQQLLRLLGPRAAADAFVASTRDTSSDMASMTLLGATPVPWTLEFSRTALEWVRHANDGKGAAERMSSIHSVLAEGLATDVQGDLERWLDAVRDDDSTSYVRALRNVITHLSFRTSIDKAFCAP